MDLQAKREALCLIPYGLYAVTCNDGAQRTAFTASWLTQCSFEPPLVAMAVRRDSLPSHLIAAAGSFAINFVGPEHMELLKQLVKPASQVGDKLAGQAVRDGETGAPLLACAVAWLECRVIEQVAPGDHSLVIGEVVAAGRPSEQRPLILADTPWRYGG